EISTKLGVDNLEQHKFRSIPARIPGYPDPEKAGDLDWLAMRWGAEHFKRMFDEIFIEYGRSLKKDLIVAQWNHLSHVSLSEERMFLPSPSWGRGEDYFWYSGGSAFVRQNLNLSEGKAGDAWLSGLYVRELGGGKPFVMGKYDGVRLAASMAEGYAVGGMGMGRYMRFEQPAGFDVLARYTNFMHKNRNLYDRSQPLADVAIILPRQSVWNGQPDALDEFRRLGQALVERQVLLDVVADENLTPARLAKYPAVVLPKFAALSDEQLAALRQYAAGDGLVLKEIDADSIASRLRQLGARVVTSPWTVRVSAYSQPSRVVLHLVNYDRDETADKRLKGPELERPKPVENVKVDLRLPKPRKVKTVELYSPDAAEPLRLPFQQSTEGRVSFQIP
ncbi:MAG: hypothetical protein N2C14_00245, partial [Planctomycetales bacterium]